jgi:hypothetical protein
MRDLQTSATLGNARPRIRNEQVSGSNPLVGSSAFRVDMFTRRLLNGYEPTGDPVCLLLTLHILVDVAEGHGKTWVA